MESGSTLLVLVVLQVCFPVKFEIQTQNERKLPIHETLVSVDLYPVT